MANATILKTALHDWHSGNGGKLVDFAGWSMPIQYESIIAEHNATRERATLFDVSHMGRFRFDGEGAADFLDGIISRRVTNLKHGQIRYGLVTKEDGGILDDILVYHLVDHDRKPYHFMVVNAGNREKIAAWISERLDDSHQTTFTDQTLDTAMIAIQGPRAVEIADAVMEASLPELAYYNGMSTNVDGIAGLVSRTGYTGEDGCEIIVDAKYATQIWQRLIDQGHSQGITAAGLGARDTLRLEAAMPLYGHELNESIDPYQAGLGFAVHLKDRDFPGRDALAKIKKDGPKLVRIGLKLDGKRVPREHYPVLSGEQPVGEVTSGTFSPTLQQPLAMAYVPADLAEVGTELNIDIRGRHHSATVCKLPFYERPAN